MSCRCQYGVIYDVHCGNRDSHVAQGKQAYKACIFAGFMCGVCVMPDLVRKHEAAYFTVEASFILPIVMLFTVMMIFLSFYSYDRCVLEHSAYEAALRGTYSHIKTADEAASLARTAAAKLVEGKLFAMHDFKYDVAVDADKVTVHYSCVVNMPLMTWLSQYISDIDLTLDISRSAVRHRPARFVRDCRIVNQLVH